MNTQNMEMFKWIDLGLLGIFEGTLPLFLEVSFQDEKQDNKIFRIVGYDQQGMSVFNKRFNKLSDVTTHLNNLIGFNFGR